MEIEKQAREASGTGGGQQVQWNAFFSTSSGWLFGSLPGGQKPTAAFP